MFRLVQGIEAGDQGGRPKGRHESRPTHVEDDVEGQGPHKEVSSALVEGSAKGGDRVLVLVLWAALHV